MVNGELTELINNEQIEIDLQFLLLGSLGPSTVTFIAFVYVATCGGDVEIVIVNEKLLPMKKIKEK